MVTSSAFTVEFPIGFESQYDLRLGILVDCASDCPCTIWRLGVRGEWRWGKP